MGWWQINADTLARTRFVLSPLAETFAAVKLLHAGTAAHPGERAWLDAHLPAYERRLSDDPVTALLIRSGLGRELDRRLPEHRRRAARPTSRRRSPGCGRRRPRRRGPISPSPSQGRCPPPCTATTSRSAPGAADPRLDRGRNALLGPAAARPGGRCRRPDRAVEPGPAGRRPSTRCGRARAGSATTGCRSISTSTRRARSPAPSWCSYRSHRSGTAGCHGRSRTGTPSSTPARACSPTPVPRPCRRAWARCSGLPAPVCSSTPP